MEVLAEIRGKWTTPEKLFNAAQRVGISTTGFGSFNGLPYHLKSMFMRKNDCV